MPATQPALEVLWQRVEDARLQWKSAHSHVKAAEENRADMPSADGSYAHLHTLHAQRVAVANYCRALQDFTAALAAELGPAEPPKPKAAAQTTHGSNGHGSITPREREVLALIAAGKSGRQIAAQLGIAFRTAVCHRYRLYRKLNVHTSVELTRTAMRLGWVELGNLPH